MKMLPTLKKGQMVRVPQSYIDRTSTNCKQKGFEEFAKVDYIFYNELYPESGYVQLVCCPEKIERGIQSQKSINVPINDFLGEYNFSVKKHPFSRLRVTLTIANQQLKELL